MSEPLIVLTDTPTLPEDRRCPNCWSLPELRVRSLTYGPLHDVCSWCQHQFKELTVSEKPEDDGDSDW